MSRRPVQFGLGDLETRFGELVTESALESGADGPPGGPATYVHAGEIATTTSGALFSTVLGSCVAVCLWEPGSGAGGMNHFLLPDQASAGTAGPRYGNVAFVSLLSQLGLLGVRTGALRAKLFGGAGVLVDLNPVGDGLGRRNVELARALLAAAGIPIVAEDVGGSRGRKLIFRTDDGAAWVRKL